MTKWLNLSTVLAAAPFVERFADLAFKRIFGRVSNEIVAVRLRSDNREAVRSIAEKEGVWSGLETYAEFGHKTSEILQISVVALIGLFLSQIEVTGSVLSTTVFHLLLSFGIICYLIFFLIKLAQNKIDPAKVGSTKSYYRIALIFCILVIVISHVPKNCLLLQTSTPQAQKSPPSTHQSP